mgnify:CR=1 FL=1
MRRRIERGLSLLLTVVLLTALLAPAAQAAGSTVSIRTAEDLIGLARSCTLDTWSQGKTVYLEADLDLSGTAFTPIPTFGGTFRGNGHTISGLELDGSGNARGLFRYLQSGALVQDLTVEGTILPRDWQDDLGLLAGHNAGRIVSCTARGTVQGEDHIGGLVGVNEASGALVGCRFSGTVTGKHSVGGIVGENHGTLTRCENDGSIDTKGLEDDVKREHPDETRLNAMENVPAYTDIGGVAGYSDGTIQSCTNNGAVGYDRVGYNIGGIVGRQSGWLDACTNTGTVCGRKDVGGIVGQLEPEVMKTFSQDFLDRLLAQMDDLTAVLDRTADHADRISGRVHAQLQDLSGKARDVKDVAGELTDAMTDWANGSIDQVNELSARISWSLDRLSAIMDDVTALTDDLDRLVDDLERVRRDLADAADDGSAAADDFQAAFDDLKSADATFRATVQNVQRAMSALLAALVDGSDRDTILDALNDLGYALTGFEDAYDDLLDSAARMKDALGRLPDLGDDVQRALDDLAHVSEDTDRVTDRLTDVTTGIRDLIDELADMPEIRIDPIGPEITDKGDALQDAMDTLLDSADALDQVITSSSDTLIDDMRAINAQFRAITDLIRSEKASWESDSSMSLEDRIRDRFQDVSDTCDPRTQHDGRVSACRNEGTVSADTAVGGVIGSIGIESDFDVDEDVGRVGDYSLDSHYRAKALVSDCIDEGTVTGRGDAVGGIVGMAWLGRLTGCQSYGTATSDGSYVGGIAGRSEGSVDSCWSKATLTGTDHVGGIVGCGSTVTSCRSLVRVTGEAWLGAVAGEIDADGSLKGNTFTHESLGGVDGISYAGKAEPVAYDTLCAGSSVPKAFGQLTLTFRADGKVVAVMPFQYGRGLDTLPEIPARKGCSASWPDLDYTHLTASQTLDAIYTPYRSALTDGEGDLPQILVDGSFSSRATVSHTTKRVEFTDARGKVHTGDAVTVTLDDPDLREVTYTVHYRLPDTGARYALWVETEDGWTKQDSTVDGSYLLFTTQAEQVTFCVQERAVSQVLIVVLAIAGAAAAVVAVVLVRRWRSGDRREKVHRARRHSREP